MNFLLIGLLAMIISCSIEDEKINMPAQDIVALPEVQLTGDVSIEETLLNRRSIREYSSDPLSLHDVSQMAWSAQGISDKARGFRTAPSAGATFPIEIYLNITGIPDVKDGVYRYNYRDHLLELKMSGDRRQELYEVSLRQPSITNAPVVMIITGVLQRTEQRYGQRALRYVYMEAGHVAQNVYLQGVALGIGTVVIGAFDDQSVVNVMRLADGEHPLYIMPLGKMK